MCIGGPSFRRAVAASVGLHVLIALAIALAGREQSAGESKPSRGIDTRVAVQVRFEAESVEAAAPVTQPEPDPPPLAPPVQRSESAPTRDSRPPVVKCVDVPQSLPPELLALMRRPRVNPISEPRAVQTPAGPDPASAAAVRPAADTATSQPRLLAGSLPIHGALPAGQTIVYVLDASGSMGQWGKFDVARRALLATLKVQPDAVKFQVVVYSGMAEFPVRVRGRMPVPATAENLDRAVAALQALGSPAGRSNHLAALRTALELEPDIILILTDAADWPSASLRAASKRAVVYIARVTADGVGSPIEAK